MKVQNEADGNLNGVPIGVRKQMNSDPHRLNGDEKKFCQSGMDIKNVPSLRLEEERKPKVGVRAGRKSS